jgi:hypothetical protein
MGLRFTSSYNGGQKPKLFERRVAQALMLETAFSDLP